MAKHKGQTRGGRRRTSNTVPASTPVRTPLRAGRSPQPEADSFQSPLARVLAAPHFARLVPHLAPETLHHLIRHSGLDACGELVAAATPEQLTSVLDLDLWRHGQPGRDEQFDVDRFGEWLEVLVDTGGTVAARIVAAMDPQLVIAGLSRYVRVFDPSAVAPPVSSDDDVMDVVDVTPHGEFDCEVGGYLVCATRGDAWDAIVALLVALAADHQDCFHTVMRGCRRLSNSMPEVDGLDELLMEPQQQLLDVTVGREQRRSQQGYSTPADARAFLQLARRRRGTQPDGTPSINPIAAAYFRAVADTAAEAITAPPPVLPPVPALEAAPIDGSVADALDALVGVLAEAGLVPQRPRALLEGASTEAPLTFIRPLMAYLRDTDLDAHFARSRELAFLANTLMAGCSVQSRPLTPQEASDAVVGTCNLGLEHWPARWPGAGTGATPSTTVQDASLPEAFLAGHDLVTAFEVGWAVLHEDVSVFVAQRLIVTLSEIRCVDADIQRGLVSLKRELVKQREAGTPWRAREALEVLAMLDMPAWASLLGLLDECPVLPAALTASIEGRTGAVSATAFEFISTTDQIGKVRAFMGKLVDRLAG
jgi:hypothetical protein